MIKLFKKDILISWKELIIVALYVIVVPLLFFYTKEDKTLYLPFYLNIFPILFFLSRNCYKEDSKNNREFIKILGISEYKFYFIKYIFLLLIIFLINMISLIYYLALFNKTIFLLVPLSIFVILIYTSVFLFLFYLFNYSYAQFTLYLFLIAIGVGYALSYINKSFIPHLINLYKELSGMEVILIGLIFYFLTYALIFFTNNLIQIKGRRYKND